MYETLGRDLDAGAPLAPLVRALCALGDLRRHALAVDRLLDGVALPLAEILPRLAWAPDRYARTRVFRDERFELILLTWARGSLTPVHDHAGQDCWLVPLAGRFDVDDFAIVDEDAHGRATLSPLRSRRLAAGELDHRDSFEPVHAVSLTSSTGVSLHVYARPIDRCRIFDVLRGRWRWMRLVCDAEAPSLAR